ncbi:MAG: BACON domain-containing carbohydrate-binding protein [Acidobacteriota bacterium]
MKPLRYAALLIALFLSLGALSFWRASTLNRAAASVNSLQGQRLTVQLRSSSYSTTIQGLSIFGDGGCPTSNTNLEPNTPTVTAPYAYECKEEKLSGQAVMNFPAGPVSGTLDSNGDLVLDAPLSFTGAVSITGEISRNIGGDNRRFLDLTSFYCPAVRDTKQISLTPALWSATYNCSLNKLEHLSAGSYGLSGLGIKFFGGRLVLDSRVSAVYGAATVCTPLLRGNLSGPAQGCLVRLRIDATEEVFAGNSGSVVVSARQADDTLDTNFSGTVQVSLAPGTTPKIGCLYPNNAPSSCAASQTVTLAFGLPTEPLSLQTPEQRLTSNTVLKAGDPPLVGNVIIKAEAGNVSATRETRVKSPLDLNIGRIEVQQGVKHPGGPDPGGLWIGERDLMIRVFLDANRNGPDGFDKYSEIRGITAKLIVKNKAGIEIAGSPFPLNKGGINNKNEPAVDYTFLPNAGAAADGSDSLNYVLNPGTEEQLNLEVKLDATPPERNTDNNSASYAPLNFGSTRQVNILYYRLRVLNDKNSTGFPRQAGIDREIEFIKQAWPVGSRSLRFLPQDDETSTTNPVTGDPGSRLLGIGFWINAFSKTGVRYVYFVDKNYFDNIQNDRCADGVTPGEAFPTIFFNRLPLTTFFSVVNSDRCATYPGKCGVLAHELGHSFDLGDTYKGGSFFSPNHNPRGCNGNCNAVDEGNLTEAGHYSWFHHQFITGFPAYLDFMGSGGAYMGLCHGGSSDSYKSWSDVQTWDYLKSKLVFAPPVLQQQQAAQNAAGNYVIVQGQVNKNGTASFGNCYTLPLADPENSLEPGSYVLETLDANSAILNSSNFTPKFKAPHLALELERSDFSFALPFSNAVRQLRLRSGGAVLATRMVSANAPTARFVSDFSGISLTGTQQVSWAGSDADGDALTYDLFYSPDGQLRLPLTETTATSYAWKTDNYPSGSSPMLTLVATDGVNATVVDSRPFTIPNRPPRITIFAPDDLFQFKVGEPITLAGSLFDPEEDLSLNPSLQWSSNLQDMLGTGKEITVSNLQAGTHIITAAGTDSQGARGSATITVVVRADNFSNLETAPGSIDFGTIAVGQTRDFELSVRNTGNTPFTVNAATSNNPQFRVLAPAAAFTLAARSEQLLTLRFTPLTVDPQTGTLTITGNASNRSSLGIAMTGKATGTTARAVATVSAASFSGQALAAESIAAAFGVGLATSVVSAATVPLPTSMAGTTVSVRDSVGVERLAGLFFVAPSQINYLIPPGTATGAATITVTSSDGALSIGNVTISVIAPGLFTANATGEGVPSALALRAKANGAQMYEPVARFDQAQNRFVPVPIDLGPIGDQVFLILFGTGLRQRSSLSAVTCQIGGVASDVSYVGEVSGLAGLDQVNLSLPRALAGRGEVDVVLTVDGSTANTVRVAFAGTQPCSYAVSSSIQSFQSSGGTGSVNVTTQNGCAWTATSSANFITITNGASGHGNGTVSYSVAANTATSQRTGTLTVAGQMLTITQAGLTCTYVISATSQSFNANANTGSISVTATNGCAWTATSNANFITISGGASGNGDGTVNYFVAANTAASQRSGTMTIAGNIFTVTQAAAATLTLTERRLTGGPIPEQCGTPSAKTSFLTTDERVYQWTLVSGAHIGDQVRWDFSEVNGSFVQTQQTAVTFDGSVCFWASMNIAGSPAASLPGSWQVRLFYNDALLFTDSFTISAGASVTDRRMTGGPIPNQCLPPPAKTSFAPTDGQAFLWILLAGATIGDSAHWEFVQPNGTVYVTSDSTVGFNGNICSWAGINIAGTAAASLPGNWKARLFYNGVLLITENFTIAAGVVESKARTTTGSMPALASSGGSRLP